MTGEKPKPSLTRFGGRAAFAVRPLFSFTGQTMAFTKQSVTVTRPDAANQPDLVNIAIGPESFNFNVEEFRAVWKGQRHPIFLVFQICIVLQQSGVNPNTATPAQIKSAIEAQTYWWGNT